jgi:uncharacterized membrane protein
MRPAVVVLGFILGSAAAITFALVGTTVVFVVLRPRYPELESELLPLLISGGLFSLLTIAAGSSFYGEIKRRAWRRMAWLVLLVMLAVVALYHAWPTLTA